MRGLGILDPGRQRYEPEHIRKPEHVGLGLVQHVGVGHRIELEQCDDPADPEASQHGRASAQQWHGGTESIPAVGTMILTLRNTTLGQIIVEASGYVVYTYAKDPKNGTPTCTGSCNTTWAPVLGVPQVTQGVTIPGTFAVVTTPSGKKQVTYNGKPLYTYKSAGPLLTTGNGIGGVWYVVKP